METRVPYLNISKKQYRLIGLTWGFIIVAMFHYYHTFTENQDSIVLTFFSTSFLVKALIGMVVGYIVSCFGLRYINE